MSEMRIGCALPLRQNAQRQASIPLSGLQPPVRVAFGQDRSGRKAKLPQVRSPHARLHAPDARHPLSLPQLSEMQNVCQSG